MYLEPSGTLKIIFWGPGSEVEAAVQDGAGIDSIPPAVTSVVGLELKGAVDADVGPHTNPRTPVVTGVAAFEALVAVDDGSRVNPSTTALTGPLIVTNADPTSTSTAAAIDEARKATTTLSASTFDRLAEGVDTVQGLVQSSTPLFGGLSAVLDKIDIFVKIGDEVANVCSRNSFAFHL